MVNFSFIIVFSSLSVSLFICPFSHSVFMHLSFCVPFIVFSCLMGVFLSPCLGTGVLGCDLFYFGRLVDRLLS